MSNPSDQSSSTKTVHLKKYLLGNKEVPFLLPSYYEPKKFISRGAYGIVFAAKDTRYKNRYVAIKKIHDIFSHDKEYQKRIYREIILLKHFTLHMQHENLINLLDLCPPVSYEAFEDVYIVTDLMDADIRSIIRSKQSLTLENVQYFLYQILRGLKFMHSAGIVHRDLKPANILVNASLDVKLCDFGLSRSLELNQNENIANAMSTAYVQTRWYRAPELLLLWEKSSMALDMWSVGCIFAELLCNPPRKVLFQGQHHLDQLNKIIQVCGTPAPEDVRGCEKATRYLKNLPVETKKDFKEQFPSASDEAIDLLEGLLCFNPEKRLTVDQALQHPFLKNIHDPEDEPECRKGNFADFNNLDQMDLKKMMYEVVSEWNGNVEVVIDNEDDPILM